MSIRLKHYHELDGVRAIAVLMVMFYHFFQRADVFNIITKLTLFGKTGVSLFFVLSGFLITRILLNTKQNSSYFKSFYIKRVLRIFPLYYFFLVLFYFVFPFISGNFISFSQQIWYWIFMQDFAITFKWDSIGPGHFWSLAIEEHFYLFWPFIIYYFPLKKIKWSIVILCIISFLTRAILIKNNIEESLFTFARFDELAIGSLLAVWELENKLVTTNAKKFLYVFVILLIPLMYLSLKHGSYSLFENSIRHLVLGLVYGSFMATVICLKETNWVKQILNKNFLSFTGKISYGLYVYHPMCFLIINHYLKNSNIIIVFISSFGFAYIVSAMSYYLMEKKFLNMKKKFSE